MKSAVRSKGVLVPLPLDGPLVAKVPCLAHASTPLKYAVGCLPEVSQGQSSREVLQLLSTLSVSQEHSLKG
jgi:hypothetical protein